MTNWIGRGLNPIDDKKPQLFSGHKVSQFIEKMRWPQGRPSANGKLFCAECSGFKTIVSNTIKTMQAALTCFSVTGECTDCHNMLQTIAKHDQLQQILTVSINTAKDSSDVTIGRIPDDIGRKGASIPPETHKTNLRWLYHYRIYLESSLERKEDTIDEHLRSLARMSNFFAYIPFENVTVQNAITFKNALRNSRDLEGGDGLSPSTVAHTLDRCEAFFNWFKRRPGIEIDEDLPGYFNLSKNERALAAAMVKDISLTFDQAISIFFAMPATTPIDVRNRAIVAMFITTGMRISALISLRGKHVNVRTRWINQDPREVDTKQGKHIRTYCLDLGNGLLDAIDEWAKWRDLSGFGDRAPFFLPDKYIQPNNIGLGFQPEQHGAAECWKSEDSAQRIIKNAALAVDIPNEEISSHDFRKIIHAFLSQCGAMTVKHEVALQLNFGHTPKELIRKHYAKMSDREREIVLDELCRQATSYRSELELYLAYERNEIQEVHQDYKRAKDIFERSNPNRFGVKFE
jgi:integrase